jgi:hypothetical protein
LKFSEQVQKNRENGPTYVVCHACVFEPGCLNYDREIEVEIERMLKSGHNVNACVRVFDALNLRSLFSDEWNIYEVFTFVAAMLMGAFEMFLLNFHVYTENFFTACVFTVISLLVWLPVAMMNWMAIVLLCALASNLAHVRFVKAYVTVESMGERV